MLLLSNTDVLLSNTEVLLSNTDVLSADVFVRVVAVFNVGSKGIVTGTRVGSTMSAMLESTSEWVVITMLESNAV